MPHKASLRDRQTDGQTDKLKTISPEHIYHLVITVSYQYNHVHAIVQLNTDQVDNTLQLHIYTARVCISGLLVDSGHIRASISSVLYVKLHNDCRSHNLLRSNVFFPNFGVIYTKLHNILGKETASELVICYRKLRGQNNIDF